MRLTLLTLASLLALGSSPLLADSIPYANVGQLAPDHSFTATGTGNVTAYFYSSDASNDDKIILWDKSSGAMTAPSLDNHSSAVGSSVSLSVTAGDSLIFILDDVTTGQYFSSVDYFGVASPADPADRHWPCPAGAGRLCKHLADRSLEGPLVPGATAAKGAGGGCAEGRRPAPALGRRHGRRA